MTDPYEQVHGGNVSYAEQAKAVEIFVDVLACIRELREQSGREVES